jgi:hypothetical protein
MMTKSKIVSSFTCATLVVCLLLPGCGESPPSHKTAAKAIIEMYDRAVDTERNHRYQDSATAYRQVLDEVPGMLLKLVPGNPLHKELTVARSRAIEGLSRVRKAELVRLAAKNTEGVKIAATASGKKTKNLLPPVSLYVPPPAKDTPTPTATEAATGGTTPSGTEVVPGETPPATNGDTTPQQPKVTPGTTKTPTAPKLTKPIPVFVWSALFGKGNTVVVRWRFTNLKDEKVSVGAPEAQLIGANKKPCSSNRHHFIGSSFKLNGENPAESTGRNFVPGSVTLGQGASAEFVCVLTPDNAQYGRSVTVIVRMSDGTEMIGTCAKIGN